MSEKTTSDQEFVRLFSPKVIEKMDDGSFESGVHVFRSAPGAGKTTLLRAFTPSALRGFWRGQTVSEISESARRLIARGVLHDEEGPQLLGVLLSCASGYADLPPGSDAEDGLFRALLDCRIVLRTLRSLGVFLNYSTDEALTAVTLEYVAESAQLTSIPKLPNALDLVRWAEGEEKRVYAELDAFGGRNASALPTHVRFEGVLWLQSIRFVVGNKVVAPQRLLMIDDAWKLRRKQRVMLADELTVLRPTMPVWLAMRSSVLGDTLLSQGTREGRDLREYSLEEMWGGTKGPSQFIPFALNVLERRMTLQNEIPGANFQLCLREQFEPKEVEKYAAAGVGAFKVATKQFESNARYSEWLARAEERSSDLSFDMLLELYVTRILISRDIGKRQMEFDMALAAEEIDDKDTSTLRNAAEIFLREELGLPYYFGVERLCMLASNNIEELLALAAALYAGIRATQVLRRREPVLAPADQDRLLSESAKRKVAFIPKSHTEGTRAKQLIESIGTYCRDRTFLPNAPYAPGVTGIRLSHSEYSKLQQKKLGEPGSLLLRVISECAADNLLIPRPSSATTGREPGVVLYLNRTICAHFGLPLQFGGWQDVQSSELINWMTRGRPTERMRLGLDV